MTFVLEEGIGRHDASAYADADFTREYATGRHLVALLGVNDEAIEAALTRAADYIEGRWSTSFIGRKKTSTQALSWPRDYAYDERGILITGIPVMLKRANVVMAERALSLEKLIPDPPSPFPVADADGTVSQVTGGQVVSERKKVGDLETATTYAGAIAGRAQLVTSTTVGGVAAQEFPEVKLLLRKLLKGGADGSTFTRY